MTLPTGIFLPALTIKADTDPYVAYAGDGSTTGFAIPFSYDTGSTSEIEVQKQLSNGNHELQDSSVYTFPNSATLAMITAPASGETLLIIRNTDTDAKVDYQNAFVDADTLDLDKNQTYYKLQEIEARLNSTVTRVESTIADPEGGWAGIQHAFTSNGVASGFEFFESRELTTASTAVQWNGVGQIPDENYTINYNASSGIGTNTVVLSEAVSSGDSVMVQVLGGAAIPVFTTINNSSITTAKLADDSVTLPKLGLTGSEGEVLTFDAGGAEEVRQVGATEVSGFDVSVRLNRLDQMAAPTANVAWGSQRITGLADAVGVQDAVTLTQLNNVSGIVATQAGLWNPSITTATTDTYINTTNKAAIVVFTSWGTNNSASFYIDIEPTAGGASIRVIDNQLAYVPGGGSHSSTVIVPTGYTATVNSSIYTTSSTRYVAYEFGV